ncbi:hypothetical protein M2105_006470 [Paenibacillus sp. PastF-1]|nr:hypothetical protein [Paenibacillus sp. PastF-1]MDH6483808.1 hypothetical protein [Paenibacillus sp. PastH-2]MDH6511169.1 hypothetical protein [Paenibacillus sp. PastM-3]
MYEVTAAEYAAIGSTITDEAVDAYWPYVDGKQHVQGVAITKQGRNMLLGTPDALHANAKMNGPYDLTLTATATFQKSYMDIPYAPGATYTIAANLGGYGARLYITLVDVAGTETAPIVTLTDATQSPVIFIAPVGYSKIRAAFSNALTGTFTFKNWQLELGSTPTPFTPAEPQSVILPVALGQIGDVKDSVYSAGTEWMYVERIKKNIILDASLTYAFSTDYTGFKRVSVAGSNMPLPTTYGNGIVIKSDGKVLKNRKGDTAASEADLFYLYGSGEIVNIYIADTDSGWGETYTPSAAEIAAYFLGYRMNNGTFGTSYNGSGTKTWTVIGATSNTGAVTAVPTSQAPFTAFWQPYTLDYVLASAAVPVVIPNAEGSITLHPGGNQISVETGIVQREKVTPVFNVAGANYWEINRSDPPYSASKTSKRLARFIEIYAGADVMPRVWAVNAMGVSGTDNGARAGIPGAYYDTTKDYYVTYIALDKYALTANVIETAATWRTGLGGVVSDLVLSTAELRQENDRQDFADDYIEAKADNLRQDLTSFIASKGVVNGLAAIDSAGNLTTSTSIKFANDDGLVYDDATNTMYVKLDGVNQKLWNSGNMGAYSGLDADLHAGKTLSEVVQGSLAYAVTTGTYAALATSLNPAPAALTAGLRLTIKTHVASPGPATLNVNGLGAKSIKKPNGNNAALALGGVYTLVYDGTAFILQGEGGEYGTAGAAQVLSGYTIGTEGGVVTGTYMPVTATYDGFGSIVPSQVNSTTIIFPFSFTVPTGKTLLALTMYNVYNSNLYLSSTQVSGSSKLCFTVSYIKDQPAPVSEIVTGTTSSPAKVTFQYGSINYDPSTGVISGAVFVTQSGGAYATLNYPEIGLNFKAQYILG